MSRTVRLVFGTGAGRPSRTYRTGVVVACRRHKGQSRGSQRRNPTGHVLELVVVGRVPVVDVTTVQHPAQVQVGLVVDQPGDSLLHPLIGVA